ncbi:hypothetical protein EYC80_009067 [Monilinia laxa]|uniref:Uncharacterized protein n=1 Tax=Monilinia laxa TaxID=61186 RepID=A0A5N6K2A9_MONLA|nr:hypothetical protein EYC80_009067 [Monilinia laxa]
MRAKRLYLGHFKQSLNDASSRGSVFKRSNLLGYHRISLFYDCYRFPVHVKSPHGSKKWKQQEEELKRSFQKLIHSDGYFVMAFYLCICEAIWFWFWSGRLFWFGFVFDAFLLVLLCFGHRRFINLHNGFQTGGQDGKGREYDQEAMGLECMFIVWMCQKLREHRDEYERSGGGMRKWPTGSWFYIPSIVKCRQKTDRNNDRK